MSSRHLKGKRKNAGGQSQNKKQQQDGERLLTTNFTFLLFPAIPTTRTKNN